MTALHSRQSITLLHPLRPQPALIFPEVSSRLISALPLHFHFHLNLRAKSEPWLGTKRARHGCGARANFAPPSLRAVVHGALEHVPRIGGGDRLSADPRRSWRGIVSDPNE